MLGQRLRCWASISPALGRHLVFAAWDVILFMLIVHICGCRVYNELHGDVPQLLIPCPLSPGKGQIFYSHLYQLGGGPRVVVSTAAFHARVQGSVPGLGGLKETKMSLPHPRVKVSIVRSLRDREVACSASDRQGSKFESCVWRTVSSQSSHQPQEVLLAQFSLYVHKGSLKPDSFHLPLSVCASGFKQGLTG